VPSAARGAPAPDSAMVLPLGLPAPHGPGTFLVDVDALLPAAPTFPIHLALGAT